MKTLTTIILHSSFFIFHLAAVAAIPQRWTVETSRLQPAQFEAYHGETLEFAATMQTYGKPLAITNDLIGIYWQTNGMGSAYWTAPAEIRYEPSNPPTLQPSNPPTLQPSNLVFSARWTPEMDVGANVYSCFIGAPGEIYRAAFQLRLRPSPGATPSELPLPVKTLDFAQVQVLNAPYYTRGETDARIDSATNAIRSVDGAARPLPKYLHALDFDDTYPEDAAWYYAQPQPYGSCSARRVGNLLERNYDWKLDEAAEFVVRMSASTTRFASVGVANVGTNLTEAAVTSGKWSRYYKCLPGRVVDGINENGVVCEVNVVDGEPPASTGGDIHPLAAVRWALDNGSSAGMVASNLAARISFPAGWSQNFHWMIADAASTWIVENGSAHDVTDGVPVMTNFRLYPTRDTSGAGQERYDLLAGGANITNAWFTRAYLRTTDWASDFDTPAEMEAAKVAWETHTREQLRGKGLWQTVHTSIYDVTNKTMRIAVQETADWYTFACPAVGTDEAKVREIVEPMIEGATTNKADRSELAGYVPWANAAHNAVTIGTRRSGSVIGANSLAQGVYVEASGIYSHAEGGSTQATGADSHAEGWGTTASGGYSHAEGYGTTASGDYGSHAEGRNTTAAAEASHAGGHRANTLPDTKYGFSHGNRTIAATGAIALGYQAVSAETGSFTNPDGVPTGITNKHKYSFVWQGKDDSDGTYYHSHGDGTFNINPIGGLGGFWIGSQSLQSLFDAKQPTISDLATIRAGAAAGATAVQPAEISDMETKTHAAATYQPKGSYLTSETDPTVNPTNPTFSNAVLAVGLNIADKRDKGDLAVYKESVHSWVLKNDSLFGDGTYEIYGSDKWRREGEARNEREIRLKAGTVDVYQFIIDPDTVNTVVAEWIGTQPQTIEYTYMGITSRTDISTLGESSFVPIGDTLVKESEIPTDATVAGWGYIKGYTETDPSVDGKISTHNTSTTAHADIRTAAANAQAHSEATRQIVSTWEGFLDGSNVVFSITNFISGAYSLDHAKLQIKELLPDSNEYRIVYDSRTEITNHTAAAKCELYGVVNSTAAVLRAEIAAKGDKAWGRRSSTGQEVPVSNTVWVTEQNLRIAGGMEYERVAVGEGAIYVLASKGQTPYMTGDEGALMLKDDGGTNYFGMVRSDSYTIGCNTDGIHNENNLVYLDYAVTMSNHPCIWYTESLEGDVEWEQLNLPDGSAVPGASHQVVWDESPRLGAQECYINCPEAKGFFRATIEVAGDARFRTNMPAEIPSFFCADDATKKVKIIWNNGNPKFVEAN